MLVGLAGAKISALQCPTQQRLLHYVQTLKKHSECLSLVLSFSAPNTKTKGFAAQKSPVLEFKRAPRLASSFGIAEVETGECLVPIIMQKSQGPNGPEKLLSAKGVLETTWALAGCLYNFKP